MSALDPCTRRAACTDLLGGYQVHAVKAAAESGMGSWTHKELSGVVIGDSAALCCCTSWETAIWYCIRIPAVVRM